MFAIWKKAQLNVSWKKILLRKTLKDVHVIALSNFSKKKALKERKEEGRDYS